ncbi:hypothetical protein ABW19_dt0208494 [Dactylella cylindrospora]|nr:hypothetical protein ABW19_dt0208494 [Dactylella cylindrospora]
MHLFKALLLLPLAAAGVPLQLRQCVPWGTGGTCTPSATSCDFYTCLDDKADCGPTGYPLGYALPFCEAITAVAPTLSTQGQAWFSATKLCLQEALTTEASCQTSCFDIFTNAFASHVPCYIDSGFCSIKVSDLKKFFQVVGVEGTISPDGLELWSTIYQQCVTKFLANEVSGGWVEKVVELLEGN